ncbi:hypothetical protein [Oligoflexus tunisiensis]|uniref:hypothetical protein n=1 Tax=Oligoflexus tunisiensis TaxID=708132 RepID=UPI00114C8BAD|nr:hypothetical protein [Oligoflexus tunisiensis]
MTQKSLEAKEKAGNRRRSVRKRYLNIIYFIDSKRTHTLKFSIKTGYLTVGTLGLLVSWSLVASLLLVREHGLNKELRARSRNLLSVIFNYQTRYDQVYEKAYPNDGHPLHPSEKASEQQVAEAPEEQPKPQAAQPVIRPAAPNLAAKAFPPSPAPAAAKPVPEPQGKVAAKAPEGVPTIAIENFSSAIHNEILTVRFSLKNTNKGSKASGTVTAQARFFENGKEGIWLETQAEANDNSGDADDQEDSGSDQHFNIRYYKNKVYHFASPAKRKGLFTAVKITVKDDQGRVKDFAFPLTKEPKVKQTRLGSEDKDSVDNTVTQ